MISRGQRPGSLFVPMHWNNQFARRGRVNDLLSAITDPWSGQPESKQVAVAIAPWRPAWQGELFCRQPVPLPASVHWRRRATSGVSHLSLAGEHHPQEWLTDWCRQQGWQMQTAQAGARWSLLAWHEGTLMLGWWSHLWRAGNRCRVDRRRVSLSAADALAAPRAARREKKRRDGPCGADRLQLL
ncbi:Molydopterin dinucleotide binding domain [Raoultella planticola]|uniref:Molydopterin dinucleotide binding domain n=1 Tax=Raoultella planticola TaxID=575 RepID=A0A485ARU5_RAOPL|nr:Molydopterin dinucleotide binding domain [Raoultella planticola]